MGCLSWSKKDADHFRPLCINTLRLETPPDGFEFSNCSVCVAPTARYGACADCPRPPAYCYKVTLNFDPDGPSFGSSPATGCSSDYIRSFLLYYVSTCRWESAELEFGIKEDPFWVFPDYSVICVSGAGLLPDVPRPRVVMTLATETHLGANVTSWTVQANFRNQTGGGGLPIRWGKERGVVAKGWAKHVDCMEAVFCPFSTRNANAPASVDSSTPFLNQNNANSAFVTMTAQVTPLY